LCFEFFGFVFRSADVVGFCTFSIDLQFYVFECATSYVRQLPLALELFKWMEQKEMARPLYTFNALIVACGRVCSKLCHFILVSMLSMFISLQLPRFRV
jgi:hypothetical protein